MKKLFGAWNPEETRRFHAPISVFGFRLTIQNTANRHVSNAFDLLGVFISFPLTRCCCCCCEFLLLLLFLAVFISFSFSAPRHVRGYILCAYFFGTFG